MVNYNLNRCISWQFVPLNAVTYCKLSAQRLREKRRKWLMLASTTISRMLCSHTQVWQLLQVWGWAPYLYTGGWTSSSLGGGSCRTGALGGWEAYRLFAPQTWAHRSDLPPGARKVQASHLFQDKESRLPAWGLPERDSSSLRIGQLSWVDPRCTGGKRLGRSSLFPAVSQGALLLERKNKRAEQEGKGRENPLFP